MRSLILLYQFPLKSFLDKEFVTKMWRKYFMAVNEAVSNEDINMYYKVSCDTAFIRPACYMFHDRNMFLFPVFNVFLPHIFGTSDGLE